MKLSYIVDDENNGKTVQYILRTKLLISGRLIKKLKHSNQIYLNGLSVFTNAHVKTNDEICATIEFEENVEDIIPQEINIDIVFEDDCLVIINKVPGIVVHPTCSHPDGTIANGLINHYIKTGTHKKIRPVSRLDRDTSGLIVFAKNQFVQDNLISQMHAKTFIKKYIGIASGVLETQSATIDLPIDRKPGSIMLRHISPTGSPSITHYKVIEKLHNATFLGFILETGRTHQIRVHCQAIGHPLLGDGLYSDIPTDLISRQALHSHYISFTHPVLNKVLEFEAGIPEDMQIALRALRK